MPTVFIIGASRGLGLGLVRQYISNGWTVHATVRTAAHTSAFPEGVVSHILDVQNEDEIRTVSQVMSVVDVDLLIHNAGVGRGTEEVSKVVLFLLLTEISIKQEKMIRINTDGPFQVIKYLFPSVLKSNQKKIAILSSQVYLM